MTTYIIGPQGRANAQRRRHEEGERDRCAIK